MYDFMSIGTIIPIDLTLFYFWLAVWYLIILFHSWNIPEIWDKIKGVETLFLAGILGYFMTLLTSNIISPVIDLISITIKSGLTNLPLVDLPTKPGLGPGNDIINIISLELFVVSISIAIFTGILFFLLWFLRYTLDPEGIIFKRYRRFREINKFKINVVIPVRLPRFMFFFTMVILILFEAIFGSILNILKLPLSVSSTVEFAYYILGIFLGLIMFIILIPFIKDDFRQIYAIISAVFGKIGQFCEKYATSTQSENVNIYFRNIYDKNKNILFLFVSIWYIVALIREYNYSRLSIVEIEIYLMILILAIVSLFLFKKYIIRK